MKRLLLLVTHLACMAGCSSSAALLDERVGGTWTPRLKTPIDWDGVYVLFTDHPGLTKDPGFVDDVLYIQARRATVTVR